jgi:hypothetical protein
VNESLLRRETAAFLDSEPARALGPKLREPARRLVEAWLACCFDGAGKAPNLLDGEDVRTLLAGALPAHLGRRDPLADLAPEILGAFLQHLEQHAFVPHAYEQRRALEEGLETFQSAVRSGELAGRASALPARPFSHRADKVGRNDPCPCGSGQKFKQCCMRLAQ